MIKNRKQQAFTLSELLVVVAIVGILVAISIPVFASQREKARRAVDMDTARKVKSALVLAYNNEEIQVPKTASSNGYGTWVMLCNGTTEYAPQAYRNNGKTVKGMWCGANKGVTVHGHTVDHDWTYNKDVENILKAYGLDTVALRTHSNGDKNGWDWIIIEVGYNEKGEFISRMYSGYKNQNGAAGQEKNPSNLEKMLYKTAS